MKRILFGMIAATGLFAATSCSQDADLNGKSGKEGSVTFNVQIEQVIGTRAISDGKGANILYYQVFDQDGTNSVTEVLNTSITDLGATVNIELVSGETYKIAFWAQNSSCTAYDVTDLSNVTIDYQDLKNNDETMDAFFANYEFTLNSTLNETVKLYRPFAQINVGVLSENADALGIDESSITLPSYYNSINLVDGNVGQVQESELTLALNNVPSGETFTLKTTQDATYAYLSTTYVLVPIAKQTLNEVNFAFSGSKNYTLKYDNVPLQRNYRTNIITGQDMEEANFTIVVEPAYNEQDNNFMDGELNPTQNLVSVTDLKVTLEDGNYSFSANFTGDIDEASFICTPKSVSALKRMAAPVTVTVTATVGEGTLTATEPASSFVEGYEYTITVNADGNAVAGVTGETTLTPEATEGPGTEPVYQLITSEEEFTSGQYIIVSDVKGTNYAMPSGSISGKIVAKEVSISANEIATENAEGLVWNVTKVDGGWQFATPSNSYLSYSSSTNFSSSNSASIWNSASVSEGIFTIIFDSSQSTKRAIVLSESGNTYQFGAYASQNIGSTSNNQTYYGVKLYKYTGN